MGADRASLDRTKHLGSLVGSMFEVTEKKRLVDMHLNIATALFERIKQRNLDAYLKLEEAITTHATPVRPHRVRVRWSVCVCVCGGACRCVLNECVVQDKKEILGLLAAKGDTAEDKLRLFLIFYLTTAIPEEDLPRYEAALTEAGVDLRPFQYLKKFAIQHLNDTRTRTTAHAQPHTHHRTRTRTRVTWHDDVA